MLTFLHLIAVLLIFNYFSPSNDAIFNYLILNTYF
jgi:hypothetical protein